MISLSGNHVLDANDNSKNSLIKLLSEEFQEPLNLNNTHLVQENLDH
jgi:hypothetical protein